MALPWQAGSCNCGAALAGWSGIRNHLRSATLSDRVQGGAKACQDSAGVAQLVELQPSKLKPRRTIPATTSTSKRTPASTSTSTSSQPQQEAHDPDLALVIEAWDRLPEVVKQEIVEKVRREGER